MKSVFLNTFIGVVLATTLLVGCTSAPVFQPKEPIPDALLVECQAPTHLDGMTGKDIINNYTTNAQLWKECRDVHSKLIQAVKSTQ